MAACAPVAGEDGMWRLAGAALQGEVEVAALPDADQHALLAFLQANKVPLFVTHSTNPDAPSTCVVPALETRTLAAALEGERERCDRQRGAYVEAAHALKAAGIPTVLFKSIGSYPYTSSNVDVLVPAGAMDRAVAVLTGLGHHEIVHYWEPNKRLLHKFVGTDSAVSIHLHEKVAWIVLAFLDMEVLWARARSTDDPDVVHPAPEHVVAALLAHTVYETNKVGLGDVWKVRQAASAPGFDWGEVVRIATARSWLPGLALARYWYGVAERTAFGDSALLDPTWREPLPAIPAAEVATIDAAIAQGRWPVRLSKKITKRYFFRKLLRENRRSPGQKLWDLIGVARQLTWGRAGMRRRPTPLICMCGIDGSGKTSHAEAVRTVLERCEVPSLRVWMRGGYSPAVEWLKRTLRRTSSQVPDIGDREGKRRVYRSRRTRLLWGGLVVLEQVVQAIGAVRWPRLRGRALVAERYIPDTLADLTEKFGDPAYPDRLGGRLLRWLTPRPDLIILLDLPGEVAHARKPDDFDAKVLEARRQVYLRTLGAFPQAVVIDATRPLDELQDEIVDRVLTTVLEGFRTRNRLNRQRRDGWE